MNKCVDNLSVRVVIPAYAAMASLSRCVESILRSDLPAACEIVVVDDGGNDGLEALSHVAKFSVVRSMRQNASLSRNAGCRDFKGDVVVFIDADVQVDPQAIRHLLTPICAGSCDASFGSYSDEGAGLNFYQQYKQLYVSRIYSRQAGAVEDFFWTALCAVKRNAFEAVGGFNPDLPGHIGEDVEFGQQLTHLKFRVTNLPEAKGKHLKDYSFGSVVRNDFKKGASTVLLSLKANAPLSHNPHARPADKLAVAFCALSMAMVATASLVAWPLLWTALLGLLTMAMYLMARHEFVELQARQGPLFCAKSIPLMYLLDLVRLLSVGAGVSSYYLHALHVTGESANQGVHP